MNEQIDSGINTMHKITGIVVKNFDQLRALTKLNRLLVDSVREWENDGTIVVALTVVNGSITRLPKDKIKISSVGPNLQLEVTIERSKKSAFFFDIVKIEEVDNG